MALGIVRRKGLGVFVVWMLAASLFVGVANLLAPPAAAQNCARSGGPQPGDWIIDGIDPQPNQVCTDIVIVMDGDLVVRNGGTLTVINGGLKFVEDTTHVYGITVGAGSSLTLGDSKVWTETNLINPYIRLTVQVSGTFLSDASTLAFPGTFDALAGSTVTFRNGSVVRSTESNVNLIFTSGADRDDNDDAPGLSFTTSTVYVYASSIEDLCERSLGGLCGGKEHILLQGATSFTAADSFLGIDFCCAPSSPNTHNELNVSGTSRAYLYGVATDEGENPTIQDDWIPAIVTAPGTFATIYRWADVSVVEQRDVPVPFANVTAAFSGALAGFANFTDNGGATTPPANILAFLGKTAGDWNETDNTGTVRMPLVSDWIDSSTGGNSRFVGTYTLDAAFGAITGSEALTFPAYPLLDNATASVDVTVRITSLQLDPPDLLPLSATWVPAYPLQNDNVTITATVQNQGRGGAANVLVQVYDGIVPLTAQTISFIGPSGTANVQAFLPSATPGNHAIRVIVDPADTVLEGPTAAAESNNQGTFPLRVTPFGPDLAVGVSFDPDPGFLNNPVTVQGTVSNVGDGNATNVRVDFYQQEVEPQAGDAAFASVILPFVDTTNPAVATVEWTPTSTGSFTFWAWVDPNFAIPEPLPYDDTGNNKGSRAIVVGRAPDLVVLPQDLTMTDTFPRARASGISIETIVRNAGQENATAFRVDFFVDGQFLGSQNVGGLLAGARIPVSMSVPAAELDPCGSHSIEVFVDALDAVQEGALYEQNNRVTKSIQVFTSDPAQLLQWSTGTITADQAIASNIEVTGDVTIDGAKLIVLQDQDLCGRHYLKVTGTGHLHLTNAEVTSNWPLNVFVGPNAQLTASGSTFTLDVQGKGALYSRGTLTVSSSTIVGDVVARGARSADLRGDTFRGSVLHISTDQTSRLWDPVLTGVQTIQLASDATAAALDFDIRNATFSAALTSQIVFSGDQVVQLTSVRFTKAGDWWAGMLTQNARVTRYWWLTIRAVDGTGTAIQDPTMVIELQRFNPSNPPQWQAAPTCAVDDCYFNVGTGWPVSAPTGVLLYRAAAEDRYGNLAPSVRASYLANASAVIEGSTRIPDEAVSALIDADTTIVLRFSELTPNLTVLSITFNGLNGPDVDLQPIGRPLSIVATVENQGEIVTRNVVVNCYSTDVDSNRDGYMDNPHASYVTAGLFIGSTNPQDVQELSTAQFTCPWTPPGTLESSRTISAVVDPSTGSDPRAGGAIPELDETDNIGARTLVIFTWPDLHLDSDPVVSQTPVTPIEDNEVALEVAVRNDGTTTATGAVIGIYTTGDLPLGTTATITVLRGATQTVTLRWTPPDPGSVTIRIRVTAAGGVYPGDQRNYDFDLTDNAADKTFVVRTQPELSIAARGPAPNPYRGQQFPVNLTVTNSGDTTAQNIVIAVTWVGEPTAFRGAIYEYNLPRGTFNITVYVNQTIQATGDTTITAYVDANNTVNEPNELNNQVSIAITIQPPPSEIILTSPPAGRQYAPGDVISVEGRVRETSGTRPPLPGVNVTAQLTDLNGVPIPGTSHQSRSGNDGRFTIALAIPSTLADGTYRVFVNSTDATVASMSADIRVQRIVGFFDQPFLGLPVWIWLIVIIGAAVAIGGGTAYVKFVGLGKLVECGECGSFIPEDSTKCPKCGVEFEKDMAKCSNCQAWIPVDVKQCPECGVEFATGEVEMADYEAQMRKQYDEVKRKFREEASRELGRTLSDREFEDWWRTQPTFVTFEDWLREEEEMRRMGSKPCPVCNTLNSVTATVCHKCGTLLKEEARRPAAGRPAAARPVTPVTGPAQPPAGGEEGEGAAGMPPEAIPKKVVKKPVMGTPVVQKKVIKRPLEEEKKEGEGGEGSGGDEEQI